ncbi:uncharacterized protein LOC115440789 [Manduca sexta]|uniref:uncharacterized protein LOC115440789 n=1 Tax=Manduca sexta TaxID=7130 RepID=UPI0018908134|nr:uncharacterized protein LOC115440789 [Manduca sexta]
MFIFVAYKDAPELSNLRRRSSEIDLSIEKTLLVNPNCPVRIMLEYIRKKCRLGIFTLFDLCDDTGTLKGLFNLPTYAYATDMFEHKKTYYVIVIRTESDKRQSVLPQLNHENRIYLELKAKVKRFLLTGESSPPGATPTPIGKVTPPPPPVKPPPKKK